MQYIKTILIIFIMIFFLIINLNAEIPSAGSSSADFLNLGVGARQIGMGGSFISVKPEVVDVFSVYWNPASIAGTEKKNLGFMHNSLVAGINQEYLGYIFPYKKKNILGISIGMINYSDEKWTTHADPAGDRGVTFDGRDMVLSFTFSKKKDKKLFYGFNLKFIKSEIAGYSANAFCWDMGVISSAGIRNLNIGLGMFNLGTRIKYLQEQENLPLTIKTGVSYRFYRELFLASMDIIKKNKQNLKFAYGMEINLSESWRARFGFNTVNKAGEGFSLGLGFLLEDFIFDYAFEPYGDFGNSHRISINYRIQPKKKFEFTIQNPETEFLVKHLIEEGKTAISIKKYETALYSLEHAVSLEPLNIEARLILADIYIKLNRFRSAKNEYEKILEIKPDVKQAKAALEKLKK